MIRKFFAAWLLLNGLLACQSNVKNNQQTQEVQEKKMIELTFKVEGMTCDHCEMSIQKGVGELPGVESVLANYEDSTTVVRFDESMTDEEKIKKAIEKRGYQVKGRL